MRIKCMEVCTPGTFLASVEFLSACLCFPWKCQTFPWKFSRGPSEHYYIPSFQAAHNLDIPSTLAFLLPLDNYLLSIYYVHPSLGPALSRVRHAHPSTNYLTSMFLFIYLINTNLLGSLGPEMFIFFGLLSCPLGHGYSL